MPDAYSIEVRGVVQGVGFRPFVYRLAIDHGVRGWILNSAEGVKVHVEGDRGPVDSFIEHFRAQPPPSVTISSLRIEPAVVLGLREFTIRASTGVQRPTVRIAADLPTCGDCLHELFDPGDRRFHYPYTNCMHCGPRYTVLRRLPYDRCNTTMTKWTLDDCCASEYSDPTDRRFHAQPMACSECGPHYVYRSREEVVRGDEEVLKRAVTALCEGKILAVKGLGGYHLACDARNSESVAALRTRKFRKEKPFALMVKNIDVAGELVELSAEAITLLQSPARPIVLVSGKVELAGVAPENDELGVMLPYTPLHHLLFAAGAPDILLMTSANRSSEPIAYLDEDALESLTGIADSFLMGERPIARRVDDSVTRVTAFGPAILRRARGYAPLPVASIPTERPILALGADLKNAITLVVDGQAFVSQHIGDLAHYGAFRAFEETINDFLAMYEIRREELLVVGDAHPQYLSSAYSSRLGAEELTIQHHRAHVASVLAERGAWDEQVIAVAFDGTGYGDDGTIWGGEIFAGCVRGGFARVAHLRSALLAGGDAAASFPVQASAGFLAQLEPLPDMTATPFCFPVRFLDATELIRKNVRTVSTTSVGRLFDTAAALLGFTREIGFEGQAAMWLERLARRAPRVEAYPFPNAEEELDFRPLLSCMIHDRVCGRPAEESARAFQRGVAVGLAQALEELSVEREARTVVLSGGVFQNELLLRDLKELLEARNRNVWTNHAVPANDGGISLGQAALATFMHGERCLPASRES